MNRTFNNTGANVPGSTITMRNRILATAEREVVNRLWEDCSLVVLPTRTVLQEAGSKISHVYFIEQGLASMVTMMSNGEMSEAGMIGFEGVVGLPVVLGHDEPAQHAIVQIAGTALRMRADCCKKAFDTFAGFRSAMLQFTGSFMELLAQTAACNRLHASLARCARWLLMASDRTDSNFIPLTQDFLAAMLGVRRTGVTEIVGKLRQMGVIEHHHGAVTILDRDRLQTIACECYRRSGLG